MTGIRRTAALLTVPVALITACGSSRPTASPPASSSPSPPSPTSPPSSSSSSSAPARTEPSPRGSGAPGSEPAEQPAFPADTSADGGPARTGRTADPAGQMHVSALRLGSGAGYARLVVDLSTAGVPQWQVTYGEASGPGGGPVTVAGDAFLRLGLRTLAAPGVQTTSSVTGSGLIAQATTTGFFEGYEEVLVGVRGGEKPFRAFALTDPGRIVIDVRQP